MSDTVRQTGPQKALGAGETDGWKMLERKLLACLCGQCLTLVPLSHQLPAWFSGSESLSAALFPGQGWSSCLLSLKKRSSSTLDFKATTVELLDAAWALEALVLCTGAVFVHLAGVVLLSADF